MPQFYFEGTQKDGNVHDLYGALDQVAHRVPLRPDALQDTGPMRLESSFYLISDGRSNLSILLGTHGSGVSGNPHIWTHRMWVTTLGSSVIPPGLEKIITAYQLNPKEAPRVDR